MTKYVKISEVLATSYREGKITRDKFEELAHAILEVKALEEAYK